MKRLILIMAMLAQGATMVADGDGAFYRVDTRTPAHELPSGVLADATNKRLEDGRAWPRLNTIQEPWGWQEGQNAVPGGSFYPKNDLAVALVAGVQYLYVPGNSSGLYFLSAHAGHPHIAVRPGLFTATAQPYYLTCDPEFKLVDVTAAIWTLYGGAPRGYKRLNDPNGFDVSVLLTDDWRNQAGEDGGRGRAWKVQSGNVMQPIPLNGHDIYGPCCLAACYNGLSLLRDGNERHYFPGVLVVTVSGSNVAGANTDYTLDPVTGIYSSAGATPYSIKFEANIYTIYDNAGNKLYTSAKLINATWTDAGGGSPVAQTAYGHSARFPAAGEIALNCQPAWNDGDAVLYVPDLSIGSTLIGGTISPAANTIVYVKHISATVVQLFQTSDVSGAGAAFDFAGGVGRFYLERQAQFPGYFGNGAPPLLAQPDVTGKPLFDIGFLAVPTDVFVTAVSPDKMTITVPNHRLIPGDQISYWDAGATPPVAATYYVNPLNTNSITIYDTQADALAASTGPIPAGTPPGQVALANGYNAGNYIVKVGGSSMPMPPARYGFYSESTNRLVLVNGTNNIIVSDPLDPLHYTPLSEELTANLGESDAVVAIGEVSGTDTLVILKQNSVLALYYWGEGPTQWVLRCVTREYGCVAPDSVCQWGSSLLFMSRRGLDRVLFSIVAGVNAVEKPVSYAMQKYINQVDWSNASLATVASWNNRLFFAFPLKGQAGGQGLPVVNNQVLALNFLNTDAAKEQWGWEGGWTGPALQVFGWAKHTISGEERMTFCDFSGNVNWLGDGVADVTLGGTSWISDSMTTRVYTGGDRRRKTWQKALVNWDTNNPLLSVTAVCPGYNERTLLTPAGGLAYNRTKYQAGGAADYVPGMTPFGAPYRADYSLAGLADAMGNPADVLQNTSEPFRMRADDWGVQLVIANAQGQTRVGSVMVEGFRGMNSNVRKV